MYIMRDPSEDSMPHTLSDCMITRISLVRYCEQMLTQFKSSWRLVPARMAKLNPRTHPEQLVNIEARLEQFNTLGS